MPSTIRVEAARIPDRDRLVEAGARRPPAGGRAGAGS